MFGHGARSHKGAEKLARPHQIDATGPLENKQRGQGAEALSTVSLANESRMLDAKPGRRLDI